MGRITLRSVWRHRRRLVSTVLAIVLGVGFMSGTLILATTLDVAADDLFGHALDQVDAVIEGAEPTSSLDARPPLDADDLATAAAVDGVAAVAPFVSLHGTYGTNRLLNRFGGTIQSDFGSGTVLENWVDEPELNPYRLQEGRAPRAGRELALNEDAVRRGGLTVGEPVTVIDQFGPEQFTLVGSFTVGLADSEGGGVTAAFPLAEVQRMAGRPGSFDSIRVHAADGTSPAELIERLQDELPVLDVRTGAEAAADTARGRSGDLAFFQKILVIFGWVSLLVGTFVIANTFTILVAQRTRELALLRALGASRRQVFASVLAEALIVGVLSSAVGIAIGVRVAGVVNGLLEARGGRLPTDELVIRPGTALLTFGMGVGATLVAGLLPAFRATRVAPIAAFREQEVDRSAGSRWRLVAGVGGLLVGGFLASDGWRAKGDPRAISMVGVGGVILIAGLVSGGPFLVGRAISIARGALDRLRGVRGRMAVDNAARSPRRTSATAAAVMISVALVVFVMAFASSARESITSDARRGFDGDFIVSSGGGLTLPNGMVASPIPQSVVDTVGAVPGVAQAAAMGYDRGEITLPDGSSTVEAVTSIDTHGIGPILVPAMDVGDAAGLQDDEILIDRVVARRYHLGLGDVVRYATGGQRSRLLEVSGISDDPNVLGYFTVTRATYNAVTDQPRDVQVGGRFDPGADPDQVLAAVRAALAETPNVWAFSRDEFVADLQHQVGSFVTVVYGLLLLSVIISVLGISNTLSLTIHERTREVGLLRSLGMDQAGVRTMIRWEAVLIGLVGTATGLIVGTGVSTALVASLRDFGLVVYSLPGGGLALIGVAALVVGVVAAIRPARQAARLSILEAIGSDH
jgi:putative ABC transport system permease protein